MGYKLNLHTAPTLPANAAPTAADSLANRIAEAAKKYLPEMQLRGDWSDGDIDFEESF